MFLPAREREADIQFYLLKNISYRSRLIVSLSLVLLGLVLEVALFGDLFWIGLIPVAAGVLLMLVKGYKNNPDLSLRRNPWRPSRREEVGRILEINKKQKSWDSDAVDITNPKGAVMLGLITAGVLMAAFMLYSFTYSEDLVKIILLNSAVILLPFWITGVRSILTNHRLTIKVRIFLGLEDTFERMKEEGEEFQFQLATAQARGGAGEVPDDLKGIILFHKGCPDFLGVQMQISINQVQGKDYPYFYCVLVAHEGFGEITKGNLDTPPRKVIIETKKEKDVYIAVIRQHTTKQTGYYTKPAAVNTIFTYAVRQARKLQKKRAHE